MCKKILSISNNTDDLPDKLHVLCEREILIMNSKASSEENIACRMHIYSFRTFRLSSNHHQLAVDEIIYLQIKKIKENSKY